MSAVTEGDISPWATAIHRLVQWVGNGRTLTTTGQLRVADGLELVQLLGTGDDPHGGAGQPRLSSSRDLPGVRGLLTGAVEAGLLRTQRGRLIPVKKYAQQAATGEGVRRALAGAPAGAVVGVGLGGGCCGATNLGLPGTRVASRAAVEGAIA